MAAPKPAVSRRICDLEAARGTRLLERGDRRLHLTEKGRFLLQRVAPLLTELQDVREVVSGRGNRISEPLRIDMQTLFAQPRWSAFAADFTAHYRR